jgi:hypothetical protein
MSPDQNPHRQPNVWKSAFKQLFILSINVLGFIGFSLIVYGIVLFYTGEKYRLLESAADAISVVSTLLGTGLTAASVWFPENKRPPDELSKRIAAPLVIAGAILVSYLYFSGIIIPIHVINGFAVLGLTGALFRLFSR